MNLYVDGHCFNCKATMPFAPLPTHVPIEEVDRLRTQLAAAEARNAELQRELENADKLIRAYGKEARE